MRSVAARGPPTLPTPGSPPSTPDRSHQRLRLRSPRQESSVPLQVLLPTSPASSQGATLDFYFPCIPASKPEACFGNPTSEANLQAAHFSLTCSPLVRATGTPAWGVVINLPLTSQPPLLAPYPPFSTQ